VNVPGAGSIDDAMMLCAARAAYCGWGAVEPNPIVGCVIGDASGQIFSVGHHRIFGGAHAEIEAIRACEQRGNSTRGATAWVTLEPCDHTGKTGPCSEALIEAGLTRVVIARRDPNKEAAGGAERLRDAGIEVVVREVRDLAWWIGEPFGYRMETGLPWVIAKWAQTVDGCIATRTGESKWISGASSRRSVHIARGRVGAIVTGIGTVLADDPMLTVRGVPARCTPVRVVIDPRLKISVSSSLAQSARTIPVRIYTDELHLQGDGSAHAELLRASGVTIVGMPLGERGISMERVFRDLVEACCVSSVLLEAGAGVLGRAFEERVVNEAMVYIAPKIMGDPLAKHAVGGLERARLDDATRMQLWRTKRLGDDILLRYTIETGR